MPDDIATTSDADTQQLPAQAGAVEPAKGVEAGGEAPKPSEPTKSYSEEDWNKRQSAWDRQVAEGAKQHKTVLAELTAKIKQHEVQARQAEYTRLIAKVEEAGGDTDLVTLTKSVVAQAQELAQRQMDFEAQMGAHAEEWEARQKVLKFAAATELVSKYGLGSETREKLLAADSAEAMEVLAAQLKIARLEAGQQPSDKVDSGGGLEAIQDLNKMSATDLLKLGMRQQKNK